MSSPREPGEVWLIGCGPGDPELLTLRAARLIADADAVVHDRLVAPQIVSQARCDAEVFDVGKQPGRGAELQDAINALMIRLAREGKRVARLKGGDPFVFGRGGEEAEALAAEGFKAQVVPGVTAGVAAPAAAGIPVTHRGLAAGVAFVTGHDADDAVHGVDWRALAAFPGTLVVYMGITNLARIAGALLEGGRPPEQPAAIVARGTQPGQEVLVTSLGRLADDSREAAIAAPAVVVVGDVVSIRPLLGAR